MRSMADTDKDKEQDQGPVAAQDQRSDTALSEQSETIPFEATGDTTPAFKVQEPEQQKPFMVIDGGKDKEGVRKGPRLGHRGPRLANGLTAKRSQFCQRVASGMSATEAYAQVFRPPTAKRGTVADMAYRLMQSAEVCAEIARLRKEQERAEQRVATRGVAEWYDCVWHEAKNAETGSARVAALREIARVWALARQRPIMSCSIRPNRSKRPCNRSLPIH